jgi:electron transfer flavoprotein alpha subunit
VPLEVAVRAAEPAALQPPAADPEAPGAPPADPVVLEVLAADPATMDLAEAERIVAAGAGLGSADAVACLARVGRALGAATGATRVVTDLGWLGIERQIGTTGVEVRPRLYLAFGVSGAVQHVSGLGQPDHVISVNTDPACPMSARAHLAVVADAAATVDALARLLEVEQ